MIFLPLKKFVTTLNFVRPNIITKLGRIFFLEKKKKVYIKHLRHINSQVVAASLGTIQIISISVGKTNRT